MDQPVTYEEALKIVKLSPYSLDLEEQMEYAKNLRLVLEEEVEEAYEEAEVDDNLREALEQEIKNEYEETQFVFTKSLLKRHAIFQASLAEIDSMFSSIKKQLL